MTTQNNKSTDQNHLSADKKSLILGGLIVILIAVTPFIFYSYNSFSNESKVWETFLFEITTNFPSMYHYAWYFVGKFVPLFLLLIWFFTCKHWWHWIILVPIAMYAFQLWGVFEQNFNMDEVELIYIIPIMMVLVPFVYLVRAKLFTSVRGDDLQAFEEELGREQSFIGQIKDLFR